MSLKEDESRPLKTGRDEAGLSLSKLVSKPEAGNPSFEFPGRASIRASTTLNVVGHPFSVPRKSGLRRTKASPYS
ncbi:MAG: hypothetical protein ABIL62_16950 [Planctomycetota bacterium]